MAKLTDGLNTRGVLTPTTRAPTHTLVNTHNLKHSHTNTQVHLQSPMVIHTQTHTDIHTNPKVLTRK